MKTWKIPVTFEMCGFVYVDSDTLEEAMEIARDKDGLLPLPKDKDYVDGSWGLSYDEEQIVRECFNDNQKDEEKNSVEVLARENIEAILADPMEYFDSTEDLALIRVNGTMILIGVDDDERLYFVLERDTISEDRYIDVEYAGMTALQAYQAILDELFHKNKS